MQNPVYNIYLLSEIPSMSKTQFIMYLFFKITYLWGQIYLWGKNSVYSSLKSYIYEEKTLSIDLLNPIFMRGNTVYCSLISYIYGWKHCLLLSEILYWWVETLSIALLNSIFMRCKLCLLSLILYLWGEPLSFAHLNSIFMRRNSVFSHLNSIFMRQTSVFCSLEFYIYEGNLCLLHT